MSRTAAGTVLITRYSLPMPSRVDVKSATGAALDPSRTSIPHIGALDGLRGAAIVGVLLYHGGHLTGGYLGVDLFFVLSGYLITSLLLAERRGTGHVSLGRFWARRARRLLPALVLVLLGVALYCVAFADPAELSRIRGDAFATIAYVANWRAIFADQSYFEIFLTPSPLQHTWSLAIEEQFYLIWPLMFVGLAAWWKRRTPQAVLVTAVTFGAGSVFLMAHLYSAADTNRAYYGTDTRAFALFAGIGVAAAVAIWGHTRDRILRAALEAGAVASVVVLAAMWASLDGQAPRLYRGGFALAGIAAALLIAAAAHPTRGPIGWALSFLPLRWLGLISYGLYLWHWPMDIVLNVKRTGLTGWPLFALQTATAIAIAVASYALIEMPIRRGALRRRQWKFAIPVAAATLIVTIIAATNASPAASNPAADDARAPAFMSDGRLRLQARVVDRLVAPSAPRVLLTGDSMAFKLGAGANKGRNAPLGVLGAALPGCGLGRGTPLRTLYPSPVAVCKQWPTVWQRAIEVLQPRAVVLFQGMLDLHPHRVGHRELAWDSKTWRRHLLQTFDRAHRIVSRAGIPLIVLTVPCFPSGYFGDPSGPKTGGSRQTRWINRAYANLARKYSDVTLIDLGHRLCTTHPSPFADGIHLSEPGAVAAWDWLTPQIRRILNDRALPSGTTP